MLVVEQFGTADNTDVLSGSALDGMPGAGVLTVYATSTVTDTLITIYGPGQEAVVRAQAMGNRTNAEIQQLHDVAYIIPIRQGAKYVISVDVQTGATWHVRAIYNDLQEVQ